MDFIAPLNFAVVEEGVYRGSYPTLRNFCFLERLGIHTIVSLVPEPPTRDLQAFCQLLGIRIIHFQINRLAPLNNPNLQKKLVQAINAILAQSSPSLSNNNNNNNNNGDQSQKIKTNSTAGRKTRNVYIHCLDGRRVTGLLLLLLRRLQNYTPEFSYSEFWKFQVAVNTPYQEELRMNREFDRFVNEIKEEFILPSGGLPRYLWDGEPYRVFPPGLKVSYSVEKEVEVVEKRQKSPDLSSASATTTSSNSTPHASTVISTTTSKSTEQNTIEETNKV